MWCFKHVNLITGEVLHVFFCAPKSAVLPYMTEGLRDLKQEEIMETSNYLGTEKTGKLLAKFCIPCIASLIISCLYNIVDQIFVGNGVGYLGNAATGVIFPITVIGWGLALFFGDGAAAYLSVALGRNETKDIHRGIGNSILFSFLSITLLKERS